jgi:hypothetical protein
MTALPALAADQLPDGVYIRLADAIYFAQDRLGSSDLQKLHKDREGWWMQSRHNPDRRDETTEAQNYGSALHALMLEGIGAYETRFAVEPDPSDYPGVLFKIDDIKEALQEAGFSLEKTSKFKLADWEDAAALHIPEVPVWGAIKRDFEASITREDGSKRPSVSAVEDRMLRLMYEAALSDEDTRALVGAGEDVPTLAELSFFWTDDFGVKRRARFDKPVPKFTMDLKTIGNWQGRELRFSVGDHILKGGLDIQVGDQHDARLRMHRQIRAEGEACIQGGTEEERTWLRAIAERDLPFDWVWLFYQKPELSGRAPILFPVWEHWGGLYHTSGYRKARRAIQTYLRCVEKFGLDRPWYRVEPIHYTDADAAHARGEPTIHNPHFGWDEDPVEGEDAHLERKA